MPLPNPIFTGRSQAALPGGVAGSDAYPTLPPSAFSDLAAWFRFGQGITVTGAGVSQWNDASGNGRHLLQGTDANRPPLQSDGSILFDGAAHFLKCGAFTLNQPETVYVLFKQITWTNADTIWDGNVGNGGRLLQDTSSPKLALYCGGANIFRTSPDLALGVYGVVCCVLNGASSIIQLNNTAPVLGTLDAVNMGGFTLGSNPNGVGGFANMQAKEAIVCSTAHDGTRRAQMLAWLQSL